MLKALSWLWKETFLHLTDDCLCLIKSLCVVATHCCFSPLFPHWSHTKCEEHQKTKFIQFTSQIQTSNSVTMTNERFLEAYNHEWRSQNTLFMLLRPIWIIKKKKKYDLFTYESTVLRLEWHHNWVNSKKRWKAHSISSSLLLRFLWLPENDEFLGVSDFIAGGK